MPGSGAVLVVVESSGGGADLQGCCGGLVVVLSTGAPAAGVHVAELLLRASTTTWCLCLLQLGPFLQHRVPTGVPQKCNAERLVRTQDFLAQVGRTSPLRQACPPKLACKRLQNPSACRCFSRVKKQ